MSRQAAGAMDDAEMAQEMNKMVAFISQEAREKAREIQVKADEEFAIEKAKIVRQEQASIDAEFEKKRKQAEVGWKISQSTALNASRLEVLREREDQLQTIFEGVKSSVSSLKADKQKYTTVLENLILEILLMMMAETVRIEHLSSDEELVKPAGDKALERFREESGRECKIEYAAELAEDGKNAGGVVGTTMTGRIRIDNTLEARLRILEEKMLPEIRQDLFGPNKNRRFNN